MTLLSVKMVFHKGTNTKCIQKCVKLRYFTVFFYSIEGPYCTISFERPYRASVAQVSDVAHWASCLTALSCDLNVCIQIYLTLCFEANTGDVGGVEREQGTKGEPSSSHHSQANGHAFILIEHVQCQPSLLVIY